MLIDLTLSLKEEMVKKIYKNLDKIGLGHLGTHFDLAGKQFPLEYCIRDCIVFNVKGFENKEIKTSDIEIDLIKENMFVIFYTGFIDKYQYASKLYYLKQPELSKGLISKLIEKKISIIGIDFPGIRKEEEHSKYDKYCANHNVFIVENLCNLSAFIKNRKFDYCRIYTFPLKIENLTGLPCRVVLESI